MNAPTPLPSFPNKEISFSSFVGAIVVVDEFSKYFRLMVVISCELEVACVLSDNDEEENAFESDVVFVNVVVDIVDDVNAIFNFGDAECGDVELSPNDVKFAADCVDVDDVLSVVLCSCFKGVKELVETKFVAFDAEDVESILGEKSRLVLGWVGKGLDVDADSFEPFDPLEEFILNVTNDVVESVEDAFVFVVAVDETFEELIDAKCDFVGDADDDDDDGDEIDVGDVGWVDKRLVNVEVDWFETDVTNDVVAAVKSVVVSLMSLIVDWLVKLWRWAICVHSARSNNTSLKSVWTSISIATRFVANTAANTATVDSRMIKTRLPHCRVASLCWSSVVVVDVALSEQADARDNEIERGREAKL